MSKWKLPQQVRHDQLPMELKSWLFHSGSLTHRLCRVCPQPFQVKVRQQKWQRFLREEWQVFQFKGHPWGMVREVDLYCGNIPVVFARTVIPVTSLQGKLRQLLYLGSKPLGEVLYSCAKVQRCQLMIRNFTANDGFYQKACLPLEDGDKPANIWARRSLFFLFGQPLLVSELFLPMVLTL